MHDALKETSDEHSCYYQKFFLYEEKKENQNKVEINIKQEDKWIPIANFFNQIIDD